MNYEAERAMNSKRLRMEGEPGHVVQGNGLPLNYMDNGHQIPYQPYAGYNTHYPPPDAFAAYAAPPGGYAPQNLAYAPPAHQNYPHHQTFPQQQQLHMQPHMVQGYGEVAMHKAAWPPQPHLLPPLDAQKPLDIKHMKPEIKLEPADTQKRPHPDTDMMQGGDLDQPKIKIKTDIFKPDDVQHRPEADKPHDVPQVPVDAAQKPAELQNKDELQPAVQAEIKATENLEPCKVDADKDASRLSDASLTEKKEGEVKRESTDSRASSTTPGKMSSSLEPKKRGRPKGSTNKPKTPGSSPTKVLSPNTPTAPAGVRGPTLPRPAPIGRPRGTGYQYAIRPFRKDFSGIQFRRRWSDDCLDSTHIPNEVYFGDVPVSTEVLFNYYDANAERERLALQAAQIAAHKAAAAKLAAAKMGARSVGTNEVTTVDSSSSDDSSESASEESDSDDDAPLKRGQATPKTPKAKATGTPGRRGRPPVPPELREPGITDMKKFCKAAGIRFDYKKLVDGCTKNKERVGKMMDLLIAAGLEGKPTMEKCQAIKQAKIAKKEAEKGKKEAKVKKEKGEDGEAAAVGRRVTRGQSGVKPRQKIVISSDEEDDTPTARRTISKLRSLVEDESDSE